MNVNYSDNNRTDVSNILERGQRKLDIAFYAEGPLKDLPSVFMIPDHVLKKYAEDTRLSYFLNVDYSKEPVEWVVEGGERPL